MSNVLESMTERAVGILRTASPIDFPASLPMYCILRSSLGYYGGELKGLQACGAWFACTSANMDLYFQTVLTQQGKWRGRGFATVLDDSHSWTLSHATSDDFPQVLAIVLHEAAHYFQFVANQAGDHDLSFIRSMLHLSYRTQAVFPFDLNLCRSGPEYGLSPWDQYQSAFAAELVSRRGEPISSILKNSLPPDAAVALYRADLKRRGYHVFS